MRPVLRRDQIVRTLSLETGTIICQGDYIIEKCCQGRREGSDYCRNESTVHGNEQGFSVGFNHRCCMKRSSSKHLSIGSDISILVLPFVPQHKRQYRNNPFSPAIRVERPHSKHSELSSTNWWNKLDSNIFQIVSKKSRVAIQHNCEERELAPHYVC